MAIVSLYALYVVGLNVFLSTSLFEKVINQDPQTLLVTYERGWTIWPGTIHARRLSIRSSDSHVQFILRIERCTFDLSFVDLARKKFHPTRVEGSGVTFDARQRIDAPAATPAYVDALPSIPGFERIPLKPAGPPDYAEKWDDRSYHLWTVHLEDVTAEDVRRIWVDTARFEGEARITGGFFLRPIRSVVVGPLHVEIRSGRTTVKELPIADPLAGTLDVHIRELDPRIVDGADLVHHVTVATDLRGRAPDLANVPRSLTGPARIAGPADLRRVAVRVVDGTLAKDSHVDVVVPGASVEIAGHRIAGDLTLLADVPNDPGVARLAFRLDARAVTARPAAEPSGPQREALLFHAPAIELEGDATALDLADGLRDLHVIAAMPRGEVPDVRSLDRYVPRDTAFAFEGGRAQAEGRVEVWLADRRAKGEASLRAEKLDLRLAKARLRGQTTLGASFGAWRWDAKRLEDVRATVKVVTGSIGTADRPDEHVVDVRGLDIGLTAADIDLADPAKAFHATIDMPDAEIVDRGLLGTYLPKGREMQVAEGHARFDARCALDVVGHRAKGTFDLHAERLGFTLEDLELHAGLRAHARVHDWAWERGDLALDRATVDITGVTMTVRGVDAPVLTIPRVALEASSRRFALSDPLGASATPSSPHGVDYRIVVEDARVDDATRLGAFFAKGSDGAFAIASGRARGNADITVSSSRATAAGGATIALDDASLRIDGVQLGGDFRIVANVKGLDRERGGVDISGSKITMRNVHAMGAAAETSAWSGELDLLQAAVRITEAPAFDAFAQLHADDAKPFLAMVLGSSVPKLVVGMFDADELSGQARIVVEPGRAAILGAHVRGGDVVAYGDYVVVGERVRGQAIVAKGPVSAGVKVDETGTYVRLFGLQSWRAEERQAALALFAEGDAKVKAEAKANANAKSNGGAKAKTP